MKRKMKFKFNTYLLRKWSLSCKMRDNRQCYMCNRLGTIEVHHIYPKSIYPEKAYDLDNGISLCKCCHIISVHAGNTFDLGNWHKFTAMFTYAMRLVKRRRFNYKYQERLTG